MVVVEEEDIERMNADTTAFKASPIHGDSIDEQIEQLMDCKPLSEREVFL